MEIKPELHHVRIAQQPTNPADELVTRSLLQSCFDGVGYGCPRCDYSTQDPEAMIHHLKDEINKSISQVAAIYPKKRVTERKEP